MSSQPGHRADDPLDVLAGPALLAAVAVGAFIEVSVPHHSYGWLVSVLALAAVGAGGAAAALGAAAAAPPAPGVMRGAEAEHPRIPVAPTYRYPTAPPTQAPKSPPVILERPTDPNIPRFGDGARAQRYPWLIPERTVQNGIAADEATVGAFAIRAASVVGPGHRCQHPAEPRQDSYRIGRTRDNTYAIVAVADGVSSGTLSDAGATTASSQAVTLLRERIERDGFLGLDVKELYQQIAESVGAQAAARSVETSELATVLITAVIEEPGPDETANVWIGWLGDSSGWLLDPGGPRWTFQSGDAKDRSAAVATNEVAGYLPDTPHLARSQFLTLPPGAALALVTDGVGDAWAGQGGNVNQYFAKAWRSPVPATRFTADLCFDAPQCLDDRTAVVVWNGGRP